MEFFKTFTYWFVGINIVATMLFTAVCIILGARDLMALLRSIRSVPIDETDDGSVVE
jgi:hypothetical protein